MNDIKNAAIQSSKNQNSNLPAKADLMSAIEKQRPGFALALPKDFDADRFTRIAITAIKANPKLQRCDSMSVLGALMLCAQLGLEPNTPLHEAAIIPYGDKAQFQIEYRGLTKLVWNSGLISFIDYDVVKKNDVFEYSKGFNPTLIHRPLMSGDRGDAYAYYAVAELQGGGKVFVVKTIDDIKKHAIRFSKSYNDGPWKTDFDAMAIKTVLKELCDKKLPKRTTGEALRFANALSKDEKINAVTPEVLLTSQERAITFDDIHTEEAEIIAEEGKEKVAEKDTKGKEKVDEKTGEITTPAKGKGKEVPAVNPFEPTVVQYWVFEIAKLSSEKELGAFITKNKTSLEHFKGEDYDKIYKAISGKETELKG